MYRYIIFLLLISAVSGYAQNSEEKLPWSAEKPLFWEDFRAVADENNRFSAMTSSGISYSWSMRSGMGSTDLKYEVFSNFYPNNSWVKPDKKNDYLLAHERLHFDISELHARKLRKALQDYSITENVKQDLREIYKAIDAERQQMQKQFDLESRHSLQKDAEEKWQIYVRTELDKYSEYQL